MKIRVLIFLALFPLLYSIKAQIYREAKDSILVVAESMPSFPGGENALAKYLNDNITYPQDAIDAEIEGTVTIRFAIAPSGDVVNVGVKDSLFHSCDSVALVIVKSMPKWIPVNRNRISDEFTLPIKFRLPYFRNADGEKVYRHLDHMPSFPGGIASMFEYIAENLKCPSYDFCVQGRVVLRFVVTEEGKITNLEVFRSLHRDSDKEAIRVVESMPDWIPGQLDGENVKCEFIMPISFRLK